jgi:hypothetical protein
MPDAIISDCGNWSVTWPYPQAYYGKHYTIAFATATADDCSAGFPSVTGNLVMFELVYSAGDWTATAMYDFGNPAFIDQLSVMDFGQFYVVAAFGYNGATAVHTCIRRNPNGTVVDLPSIYCPDFVSGCDFKGQAIIGGISSTDDNWKDLGLSGVAWSAIGSFDFRPAETNNVAGSRRIPQEGDVVYKMHRLGDGVVIFASGSQTLLHPVSEPAVTFGLRELPSSGVRSGNHVAGDDKVVAWIDRNYDLCKMTADFKMEKLGYREYMKDLSGKILMSYVPSRRRFYISNGQKCYVLTEHGMYTTDQMITSAGDYKGVLCGFWKDGEDPEIRLSTDRIDFGSQGLKTLEGVECGAHYSEGLFASVDYLYDHKATSFKSLDWKSLSPLGQIVDRITAKEFRLRLKGSTYKDATFNIDSILAKVKFSDKRGIRGLMGRGRE